MSIAVNDVVIVGAGLAGLACAPFSGERTASAVLHHLSAQRDSSPRLQPRLDGETSWR